MSGAIKSHVPLLGLRQSKALRQLRSARSHITGTPRASGGPKTPSAVKEEIAREYRELAVAVQENEKTVADSAKPSGIFGRWFHTSTS